MRKKKKYFFLSSAVNFKKGRFWAKGGRNDGKKRDYGILMVYINDVYVYLEYIRQNLHEISLQR